MKETAQVIICWAWLALASLFLFVGLIVCLNWLVSALS
jgi:hypothetical protein